MTSFLRFGIHPSDSEPGIAGRIYSLRDNR